MKNNFKIGDIVRVNDWSYSVSFSIRNLYSHKVYVDFHEPSLFKNEFKIVEIGNYPMSKTYLADEYYNDILIKHTFTKDRFYILSRFLKLLKRSLIFTIDQKYWIV